MAGLMERFYDWSLKPLDWKTGTTADRLGLIVIYGIMVPATVVAAGLIVFLAFVARIAIVILAIVVALMVLVAGARYLGVELPPAPPSPATARPSN